MFKSSDSYLLLASIYPAEVRQQWVLLTLTSDYVKQGKEKFNFPADV